MAKRERTKYPGVFYREVKRLDGLGMERMYYVVYRRGGRGAKLIEEPVGRATQGWTEALANRERAARIDGKLSNAEKREEDNKEILTGAVPLTFGRLWEIYYSAHLSNRSIRDDVNRYNRHISPQLATMPPKDLRTAHIENLRRKLEKYGLSPQSVKHCLGLVKRVIRYAAQLGIFTLPENIHFEMPQVDNRKTENMTAAQLAAYLQALDEEPDQDAVALLRLALVTGIRRGALFALRWEDCDFENNLITLQGAAAKNEKTAHIPMNEAAKVILQNIRRNGDYVFPGRDGGQRKTFAKISKRVREKAGLPATFRPLHGLRHVFASQLASSGKVDLYTLQKLLTHESAAMTQRYAHLADEALRRAANVANALAVKTDCDKK